MKKWLFGGAILALAASVWAAIGSNVGTSYNADGGEGTVVPHSAISKWVTVRDAGGMDTADNSGTVTNVTTHITAATSHILDLGTRGGTYVTVRFAYRGTPSTSPIVKAFGRSSTTEAWQVLKTRGGDITATLDDATTDATDGTDLFTSPDPTDHVWDTMGCRYIVFGLTQAQSGGTASVSYLQAKSY